LSDRGVGISSAEKAARLFDAFFTTTSMALVWAIDLPVDHRSPLRVDCRIRHAAGATFSSRCRQCDEDT